jgi:hypothetical protein
MGYAIEPDGAGSTDRPPCKLPDPDFGRLLGITQPAMPGIPAAKARTGDPAP